MHVVGPMARSVADAALMLCAMSGADARDPLSLSAPQSSPLNRPLRIGWCMSPGGCATDSAILNALASARRAITALGHDVTNHSPDIADMSDVQHILRAWTAVCDYGALIAQHGDLIGPELRRAVMDGAALTAEDLARAEHLRAECWARMVDTFDQFDLLVWPTTCGPAFDINTPITEITEDWRPAELTPALDMPALTIPFGEAKNMPVGLQILGPRGSDATILALGQSLEEQNND
ncbi:MAG: amidase family protein [Paracoccaceae bacterium]